MSSKESPTGRGYGQGSDSYRADDVAQMEREYAKLEAARKMRVCTCRNSESGMDVDRCPVHGIGCA